MNDKALLALFVAAGLTAQTPQSQPAPTAHGLVQTDPDYLLGPRDQISVFVADLPEEFADKTFRIDNSGDVSLPVIGHLHAAGVTATELEAQAREHLSHVLRNPEVSISLAAFGSESIFILGAVNKPGMHQLEGHKTLFEILSLAGGLDYENAGYVIKITRSIANGTIPLPGVTTDPTGQTYVASVRVKDIVNATNPAENIPILPGDTVAVPRTDLVYAVGDVMKPGAFPLNEHEFLSALQVVSLAEGTQKTAALDRVKILRTIPGSKSRTEIAVNLKQIMRGNMDDVQLKPDDILFIPNSNPKSVAFKTIDSVVAAATGFAAYGTRGSF